MEIKRTERGWAGHFICSDRCFFRRNTLIEAGDKRFVVSTVGNFYPTREKTQYGEPDTIGHERYYETKAFVAIEQDGLMEASTSQEISLGVKNSISEKYKDAEANDMHEAAVEWFVEQIKKGTKA